MARRKNWTWTQVLASLLVFSIVLGYGGLKLWQELLSPFIARRAVIQRELDFARVMVRSEVLLAEVPASSGTNTITFVLAHDGELPKLPPSPRHITAEFKHRLISLSSPTADSMGSTTGIKCIGRFVQEKGEVYYALFWSDDQKTNKAFARVNIHDCTPQLERSTVTIHMGETLLASHVITRGLTTDDWRTLLASREAEHTRLANEKTEQLQREKARADQQFLTKMRSTLPAPAFRAELSINKDAVPKEQHSDVDRALNSAGDRTVKVQRTKIDPNRFELVHATGTIPLEETLREESGERIYVLSGKTAAALPRKGWNNAELIPQKGIFHGNYSYQTERIGIAYAVRQVAPNLQLPVIDEVVDFSPASRAGLAAGDIIVAINGMDTDNQNVTKIGDWIQGPTEKTVNLSIARPVRDEYQRLNFSVTRETAPIQTITLGGTFPALRSADRHELRMPAGQSLGALGSSIDSTEQTRVEQLIRDYFAAAASASARPRDRFFTSEVYFYGGHVTREELVTRFRKQENDFKYRHFEVLTINCAPVGERAFHAAVKVRHRLGSRATSATLEETIYFIRVDASGAGYLISKLSDHEFPGWRVANYRARISAKDLKQAGPNGKPFASLDWTSSADLVREIVLQDRANYYQYRSPDPDDGPAEYFNFKNGINKRREEWTQQRMQIQLSGSIDRLKSGDALIEVAVYKEDSVRVQILD